MNGLSTERLNELVAAGDELWRRHRDRRGGAFHGFVPADAHGAHDALARLRDCGDSFLELGSGAGVITIVADLLGFDAHGIEIEPWLVESARELAERFGSDARFAEGSFFPDGFDARDVDADYHVTYDSSASAYPELGSDLDDFDVIYVFPWPGEEALFDRLLSEHARPGAVLLTYEASCGFDARRLP